MTTGFSVGPSAYGRYEAAEREFNEAYNELSFSEKFRASRGVVYGFVLAAFLAFLFQALGIRSNFSLFSLNDLNFGFISSAAAQSSSPSTSGGQQLPETIVDAFYVGLFLLMLACFYAAIVMRNTTMIVRDTAKTLLGFFVGKALR
ncbi:hypothetical protein [Roseiarcus sp.]|jgi:hypothetical protein|uniref:hypothetical protein n=1 Tax=Roseiarcus sp. TaxID=1969460 RepID=UPI003C60FF93